MSRQLWARQTISLSVLRWDVSRSWVCSFLHHSWTRSRWHISCRRASKHTASCTFITSTWLTWSGTLVWVYDRKKESQGTSLVCVLVTDWSSTQTCHLQSGGPLWKREPAGSGPSREQDSINTSGGKPHYTGPAFIWQYWLTAASLLLHVLKGIVRTKNENSIITSSPSSHSKPVGLILYST